MFLAFWNLHVESVRRWLRTVQSAAVGQPDGNGADIRGSPGTGWGSELRWAGHAHT